MHVALMPDVKNYMVARRVENTVHGEGKLDRAEIGGEMSAGTGDASAEKIAYLVRKRQKALLRESLKIVR